MNDVVFVGIALILLVLTVLVIVLLFRVSDLRARLDLLESRANLAAAELDRRVTAQSKALVVLGLEWNPAEPGAWRKP